MQTRDLPIIHLSGSPRQRGRVHGESLRPQIHEHVRRHYDYVADYFGQKPDDYLNRFAAWSRHADYLALHAPDLLEEVEGLAEGAGLSRRQALLMQLVDEEWAFGFYTMRPARPRQKCTAFGVTGANGTHAGQNMDVPPFLDGLQALLHIRDEETGVTSLVFTVAGLIGLCGVNSAPLGLCCNALNQLTPGPTGMPVSFLVRHLLTQGSFADAVRCLMNSRHATGQNYVLAGPGQVRSFECSAGRVVEHVDPEAVHFTCHTNHVLASGDLDRYEALMREIPADERPTYRNSGQRFASMRNRLLAAGTDITLDDLKAALSAHDDPLNPVSRTERDVKGSAIGFTAGSVIYALDQGPTLHVAAGPPCQTPYEAVDVRTGRRLA